MYDDIIFITSVQKHFDHVSTVRSVLKDAFLSLKLNKSSFFNDHADYLGHIIRPGKPQVAEKSTKAVEVLREPSTMPEVE